MTRQPFHLVQYSPWPLTAAMSSFTMASGLIAWFHSNTFLFLIIGLISTSLTLIQWWRDVCREATFQGHHTSYVALGLRIGMVLFIVSEVAFFFSFFWAFFHNALSPSHQLGCTWPPTGITPINPFAVPLLNTAVLLASGVTVTWAHHAILSRSNDEASKAMALTIVLGLYFTFLQGKEYLDAPFTISDSVYGSTFFVATGFHGAHVIIGTTFIGVALLRTLLRHNSQLHHFGFEAAAWYWHFVDVVWIFLFICIYWWGS